MQQFIPFVSDYKSFSAWSFTKFKTVALPFLLMMLRILSIFGAHLHKWHAEAGLYRCCFWSSCDLLLVANIKQREDAKWKAYVNCSFFPLIQKHLCQIFSRSNSRQKPNYNHALGISSNYPRKSRNSLFLIPIIQVIFLVGFDWKQPVLCCSYKCMLFSSLIFIEHKQ